jgi:hypothetical protein
MIALQSRNPQLPDPAAQTAKFVNMMNMAKQQEAAQRQAALAQQTMDINQQENARAGETQRATMRDKDLDYKIKDMNRLRNIGVVVLQTEDPTSREAAYQSLVEMIGQADQQLGDTVRRVAPTFNAKVLQGLIMEADKYTDKKWATPIAVSAVNARTGQQSSLTLGGIDPRAEVVGEVGTENTTPTAAAPAAAAATTTTRTTEANPFAPDAPPADVAAENVNSLGLVVASARETGVIAQRDVAKLLSVAAPGSGPKLMSWLSQNNIQVVPNAPGVTDNQMRGAPANLPNEMTTTPMAYDGQTPQSQYADLRGPAPQSQTAGLRGAPPMEQTMLQSQGRTPFIARRESPAPAETPQQAGARALATRPSKQELYDAEAAKIKAARDAGPPPVTAQQKIARKTEVAQAYSKAQTLIDKAYNPKEGIISIANKIKMLSDDQKEAITGYSNYIPSFRGTTREADTLFGNLKGVVTSLGKDAAAASGAVGNMAVQEWKIAADMIANLDLANMTPRALDAQMDRIIEQVSTATKLAERVYDIQYGEDVKELPAFKLRGTPPVRTKTPVAKGGTMISPDIDKILKSRGI